uniref:Uncharacterized protein n=1 Tax=Arundo donax TaxID=35708 RepID=A0A0A9GPV6_ARUDO
MLGCEGTSHHSDGLSLNPHSPGCSFHLQV